MVANSKRGGRRAGVSRSVRHMRASDKASADEKSRLLTMKTMANERQKARKQLAHDLAGLSRESLGAIQEMHSMGAGNAGEEPMDFSVDAEPDDHWIDEVPASEDRLESHFIEAFHSLENNSWSNHRRYRDPRTWKERRTTSDEKWARLLQPLTAAYLDHSNGIPSSHETSLFDFEIACVDMFTRKDSASIPRSAETLTAVALVRAGYLGNSTEQPSIAISITTLEFFRILRLYRCSFSVESFAKVLCHIYKRPYQRFYRGALSDAFDAYLAIRRNIDRQVDELLGQDTPFYRVLNACPPCTYELNEDPELQWRRLIAMDGNNSLKRIKGIAKREVSDTRVFDDSDYFLPHDFVNRFANEVSSRPSPPRAPPNTAADHDEANEEDEDPNILENGGDPTDGVEVTACAEHWKAAAADEKKKMWGIFSETGIFTSACRHGFILWIADMVQSGELAKYPLATMAQVLNVLGPRVLVGYDIGCSFSGTLSRSSLGSQAKQLGVRCCVNAFHGYSHNYTCQLQHHPNVIQGAGIEDFETLERVFSSSNYLASGTRYMSQYRRRVFIDLYFRQWDADKYQNLGDMIYGNYQQALDLISSTTSEINEVLEARQITEQDLQEFLEDERLYFKNLGKESEGDMHAMAYVELLQRLASNEARYVDAAAAFRLQTPADYQFISPEQSYTSGLSATRKAETERQSLHKERGLILHELSQLESRMNISSRWTPETPEYVATVKYMTERKYLRALEDLHKLVIKRLFELHKMNLSRTGYNMRTAITQSLQVRSRAIRNAVHRYNMAAVLLGRPTLDWNKISHYSFLDEFNILRDTRSTLQGRAWADPVIQETMRKYLRRQRAYEEIERCNVELRRLHTAIVNEDSRFDVVLQKLQNEDHPLLNEVADRVHRRRGVNLLLLRRIAQTQALPGFTGYTEIGTHKACPASTQGDARLSSDSSVAPGTPAPSAMVSLAVNSLEGVELDYDGEEDDAFQDEIGGIVDYVARTRDDM